MISAERAGKGAGWKKMIRAAAFRAQAGGAWTNECDAKRVPRSTDHPSCLVTPTIWA